MEPVTHQKCISTNGKKKVKAVVTQMLARFQQVKKLAKQSKVDQVGERNKTRSSSCSQRHCKNNSISNLTKVKLVQVESTKGEEMYELCDMAQSQLDSKIASHTLNSKLDHSIFGINSIPIGLNNGDGDVDTHTE